MVFTLFCEEWNQWLGFHEHDLLCSMAWISWTWSIVFLDPNPLKEYCAQAFFSIIAGLKEHALTILLSDFLFAMLFCFFPFLVVFELCAAYEHSRPVCIKTFSNWDTFIWKKALYPGWIWKKSDQSRCPLLSCKLATDKMEKFIMHCYRMQKPCVQARYVREWNW